MCVLSIKVSIRKKSGNLSYPPRNWYNYTNTNYLASSPVGLSWRIHRLYLNWRVRIPHLNEYPGYDIKQQLMVKFQFWWFKGLWSMPSLRLLPSLIWPGVRILIRVPSIGQIEIWNHLLNLKAGPVGFGGKIHRLHLCRGVRIPQRVS